MSQFLSLPSRNVSVVKCRGSEPVVHCYLCRFPFRLTGFFLCLDCFLRKLHAVLRTAIQTFVTFRVTHQHLGVLLSYWGKYLLGRLRSPTQLPPVFPPRSSNIPNPSTCRNVGLVFPIAIVNLAIHRRVDLHSPCHLRSLQVPLHSTRRDVGLIFPVAIGDSAIRRKVDLHSSYHLLPLP